jgi:hypothetical protein
MNRTVATQPGVVSQHDLESALENNGDGRLNAAKRAELILSHAPVCYLNNDEQYAPVPAEQYTNESSMYVFKHRSGHTEKSSTKVVSLYTPTYDVLAGGKEVAKVGHIKDKMDMHLPNTAIISNTNGRPPAKIKKFRPPIDPDQVITFLKDEGLDFTGENRMGRVALNYEGVSQLPIKGDPPKQSTVDDAPQYVTLNEFMSTNGKTFCVTAAGSDRASLTDTFDGYGNWYISIFDVVTFLNLPVWCLYACVRV